MPRPGQDGAPGRPGWPWAVAVPAAVAAPLVAALAAGRTLVWGDTARLFRPLRTLVVEALRQGRLPLWNPYEGFGVPLFAQLMHSVLTPVSLLAAWLAPGAGVDLLVVCHVALAAAGAFFLARELGATPAAAAVGGVAFGLSGYVVSMSYVLQYLAAASAAPWTLLALHAAGRGARGGVPAAALAVAVQVFAGDPQWLIVVASMGAALAGVIGGGRGCFRALGAGALGAAISAVQIAPALAYLREADRSVGLAGLDRTQWSLAPARLAELVLPGLFNGRPGDPVAPVFQWLGGASSYTAPFVPSVFVGSSVPWLAAKGVRASRAAACLAVAAAVSLWIALGPLAGATQLLHAVPVWGAFRYPEKLVGPLTLCLAMLAALGADRAIPRRRGAIVAVATAATLGCLAVAVATWAGGDEALQALGAGPGAPEIRHRLAVGLAHGAVGVALLAGAIALAASAGRERRLPALAAGAVALASGVALVFAVHAGARLPPDRRILDTVKASSPLARIGTPVPAGWGPSDLDHWDRVEWAEARMGLPSHSVAARVANVDAYSGLLPIRYLLVTGGLGDRFGPASLVAARRLGVSHVVIGPTWTPDAEARARASIEGGRMLLGDEWGVSLWEVPHRPWASFAPGAVAAHGAVEAHRILLDLVEAGRPEVVLEGPPPGGFAPGRVLSARRETERARVEAESDGPALLVVNDAWAPGWRATIDGAPAVLQPADAAVRAVPWPPGRHVLEMRYDPPEVRLGLWITAGGIAVLVALAWRALRPRARARSAP